MHGLCLLWHPMVAGIIDAQGRCAAHLEACGWWLPLLRQRALAPWTSPSCCPNTKPFQPILSIPT